MTDLDVLFQTIHDIDRISIPVGLMEQIGIPLQNVRNNLVGLYNGILDAVEKEKAKNSEEVKLEVVPEGDDNNEGSPNDLPENGDGPNPS